MTQASFNKYFVGKESVPSTTISTHSINSKTLSFVIGLLVKFTSVKGALFFIKVDKTSALDLPISSKLKKTCLCKLVISTVSKSTK